MALFIPFLLTINFLLIGSVNAFQDSLNATNPITETVFDLTIYIMIPVLIYVNTERSRQQKEYRELSFSRWLIYISLLGSILDLFLRCYFCAIAFRATKDNFFMVLLGVNSYWFSIFHRQ